MDKNVEVVVIGGGITGLVTTFLLKEKGVNVLLLEKANRVGGQLNTIDDEGFLFESGPNTGVISNKEVLDLFRKLGNDCTLQIARKEAKVRLIWKKGSFRPLPSGLLSAISTNLFSWHDKINILFEPFRKKGKNPNESIADLVKRRLGKSYLNYAVDPFVSGVYAGDPNRLVTRFALPKLHRLEDEYGSFIRGAIKRRKALASEKAQGISKDVFSVKGGFGQLVKALQKKIGDEFIQLSTDSIKVEPSSDGSWVVTLGSTEKKITSKKVITTVPAYALPDLLSFIDTKEIAPISSLTYAPVVQIGVGLNNNSRVPLAFGGLIPSIEKEKILGILFNSSCYDDRAPKGKASLSFFLGGMKHPHLLNLSDEEIIKLVKTGLHRMMKYPEDTPIEKIYIFRHSKAIPQYEVDTEKRLEKINLLQEKYKGLILAGGIRDGIGLADRIKQATDLASL